MADHDPASAEEATPHVGTLTLTRRPGESVLLTTPGGETVLVSCVEIRSSQVRLTFSAPRSVEIARTELLVGESNRAAVRRPHPEPA